MINVVLMFRIGFCYMNVKFFFEWKLYLTLKVHLFEISHGLLPKIFDIKQVFYLLRLRLK